MVQKRNLPSTGGSLEGEACWSSCDRIRRLSKKNEEGKDTGREECVASVHEKEGNKSEALLEKSQGGFIHPRPQLAPDGKEITKTEPCGRGRALTKE